MSHATDIAARLTDTPDAAELAVLQRHHRELAHALSTRLPVLLRADVTLELTKIEIADAKSLVTAMATPTHLALFRIEPLPGVGLLEIPLKLGRTMVDRLLGGSGQGLTGERRLSDIEVALLDEPMQTMLAAWCELWAGSPSLKPVVLAHEVDARHLAQQAAFMVATLTARLGDCEEPIHFALPCSTVRPLLSRAGQLRPTPAAPVPAPAWNELFDDVSVPVSAEFDELKLTAREVATLQVGDELPLGADWTDRIQVCLAGRPTFRARLGTQDAKWAVELTEQLENQP